MDIENKLLDVFNRIDAEDVYNFIKQLEEYRIVEEGYITVENYMNVTGIAYYFKSKNDYEDFWKVMSENTKLGKEWVNEAKKQLKCFISFKDAESEIGYEGMKTLWNERFDWRYYECYKNPDWLIDTTEVTTDYFSIEDHITEYDGNYYLNIGTNQSWNGEHSGWSFCDSFIDCIPSTEDIRMKYDFDENGIKHILIHGLHHDGVNVRMVYLFDIDQFNLDHESFTEDEIEEYKHHKDYIMRYVIPMDEDCDIIY